MTVLVSQKLYCAHKYDIRWKLVYTNKPPKIGQWCKDSTIQGERASAQDRDGLAWALVEGKHRETRKTVVLAECKAPNYIEHRWIAAVSSPMQPKGNVRIRGAIQGMTLVTLDKKIHIHLDGNIQTEPMIERSSNYA